MTPTQKRFFKWLKITVIVYCLLGIALYYLQEKFLFHPEKLETSFKFHFDQPFTETSFAMNSEDTISLIKFFPQDSIRKGVVLYFHGNRENVQRYAPYAKAFTAKGYEVWMPDYPGFGKSRGSRSERALYQQAYQVYNQAVSKFRPDQVIIYGKSFGTGIASNLASEVNSRCLVLETPYSSIPALFGHYAPVYPVMSMSKYQMSTYKNLEFIKEPVIIFHGDDDLVIPLRNAEKLKGKLKNNDRFVVIKNAGHNDIAASSEYKATIDSLLR